MTPVSFLLVDDLEENLLSLEALLRRDGLNLLKARSGDEALELLLRHDVALALVDVQMPGLNGFELAELMRGNERTRHIPIIFLTAGTTDRQRRFQGYEAGAVDFLYKPIEPDILRSKADVFFQLYRQRQQIAAQRDELKVQSEALREADRRKDEFLATLAHELRNPLAPIRHGLDLLRRRSEDSNTAVIRDMMDRQTTHLVRLIDDLLDVSRVSQGKIVLRKERVQVADVVRAAVEASRPLIDSAHHALAIDMPSDPIWLDADPTRLAQVIGNLLNNAAKYTSDGGRIDLSVRVVGGRVEIAVSDNGLGIAPDMLPQLFQLFAQAEHNMDRARGGLGIGLALVRQLVSLHGGTVEADSAGLGQGSQFRIGLPVPADVDQPAPSAQAAEPVLQARTLKVLVVDDEQQVAQMTGWLLEELGHAYHLVHDGRHALAEARAFGPDVIVLDIGLPVMDGYAVCRVLREDARFSGTPIIAQSGWGQDRDKALAAEAGFDHHLVKPVAFDELERLFADLARRLAAVPHGGDVAGDGVK
jgi:signal transduction histidine kinase